MQQALECYTGSGRNTHHEMNEYRGRTRDQGQKRAMLYIISCVTANRTENKLDGCCQNKVNSIDIH